MREGAVFWLSATTKLPKYRLRSHFLSETLNFMESKIRLKMSSFTFWQHSFEWILRECRALVEFYDGVSMQMTMGSE